jgi:hypothetical protein
MGQKKTDWSKLSQKEFVEKLALSQAKKRYPKIKNMKWFTKNGITYIFGHSPVQTKDMARYYKLALSGIDLIYADSNVVGSEYMGKGEYTPEGVHRSAKNFVKNNLNRMKTGGELNSLSQIDVHNKGGKAGAKVYDISGYSVDVHKDSYNEGEGDFVHSWYRNDEAFKASSKKELLKELNRIINEVVWDTKEFTVDDFFVDEDQNSIQTTLIGKYIDLDSGYDHYEYPTEADFEAWKKGELELFVLHLYFPMEVYKKSKAEFKTGGKAGSEWDEWNYLKLRKENNCLYLKLTPEGKEELEDLIAKGNHGELAIAYLFEDIQGNSDLLYWDKSPMGLTEAPVITEGWYHDDKGELVSHMDEEVYWFPNYMIKDFTEDLLKGETVCFMKAESYEEGGELNSLSQIDVHNKGGKAGKKEYLVRFGFKREDNEGAYSDGVYRKSVFAPDEDSAIGKVAKMLIKDPDANYIDGTMKLMGADLVTHEDYYTKQLQRISLDTSQGSPTVVFNSPDGMRTNHMDVNPQSAHSICEWLKNNYLNKKNTGGELNSLSQIDVYRGGGSIARQIEDMLKENTGVHFMDSGGEDGRAWQQNQDKSLALEPRVSYEIWNGEIHETVSTYHYLTEVLDTDSFSEEINDFLNEKEKQGENAHWVGECWDLISESEEFADQVTPVGEMFNTYNYENNLSQILQGQIFWNDWTEKAYVLLQIHGGADVRGGYTDTRCFELLGYLTGQVDVTGSIDGKDVENSYNGYSLTWADPQGGDIEDLSDDADVALDFYVMEDTYMYNPHQRKTGGRAGREYPTGMAWHMDRLWTSQEPHEVAYRPKRKSKVKDHKRDSERDSKEVWEVARKGKHSLGGFIAGSLIGGYVGYKAGRARPQKFDFETEKKVARTVAKGAKKGAKKVGAGAKKVAQKIQESRKRRTATS